MRPASDVERRRLNETFARLCAIPSPFGSERACAEVVARELRTGAALDRARERSATDEYRAARSSAG
jgi:hypothetical protein